MLLIVFVGSCSFELFDAGSKVFDLLGLIVDRLIILHTHDSADAPPPVEESDEEGDDDEDDGDLREQGAEWMTEQGFDSLDS